jgi:hypothetical protein
MPEGEEFFCDCETDAAVSAGDQNGALSRHGSQAYWAPLQPDRRRLGVPMKKQPIQSATALPPSPDEERRGRMIKYTIAMSLRFVCFFVALAMSFPPTWWTLIPIAGAVVLPYVAVVLANTVVHPNVSAVERPGSLVPLSPSPLGRRHGADG